jgi:hypothetical protein
MYFYFVQNFFKIHLCLLNYRMIHLLFLLMTFYFECYKTISVYSYFVIKFLHVYSVSHVHDY